MPDCPNWQMRQKEQTGQREGSGKSQSSRSAKAKSAGSVVVQKELLAGEGMVNGVPCRFIPDSGADITVVPEELVCEDQILEVRKMLRMASGVPELHRIGKVFPHEGGVGS